MNNLRNIPFEKIKPRIDSIVAAKRKTALSHINEIIDARNKRKIDNYVKEMTTEEGGSEGLEEAARETLEFEEQETELPESRVKEIMKTTRDAVITDFLEHFSIAKKYSWLLPQALALIGESWKPIKNDSGKYDAYLTYKHNTSNDLNYGIWLTLIQPRNTIIETTKDKPLYKLPNYNNLVPLILSALKDFQKVNYEDWDRSTIYWLVDKALADAMLAEIPDMTPEEIISFRNHAQYFKQGRGEVKLQSPISTATFYHIADWPHKDLTSVPKLALHMLCQTWCAHPANRLPGVQILDWKSWDNIPLPLVSHTITDTKYNWGTTTKFTSDKVASPWD